MHGLDGTVGYRMGDGEPPGAPPAADTVVQYVFPVEIEVRSVGTELRKDEIVEAALAALAEELTAI
jgi:hypothetical protein